MTRPYGWGPKGERVIDRVPTGTGRPPRSWRPLRLGGLFAPLVVDGPLNGDLFRESVRQQLAPRMRGGDVLVMDNLATHKVAGVAEAVAARGARVLYLPLYSPDLNPIEMTFSKVKTELRKREIRDIRELEDAFGESLDWVTPTDALHDFRHSGYKTE